MKNLVYIFLLSAIAMACGKDEISNTPELEVLSISPGTVVEFQDSIVVKIKYRDGDGDLGENDPDVKNLFLIDSRNGVVYDYRVQQLSPDGASVAIEGELEVEISNTAITDGSSQQSLSYEVYIIDRAGNESNRATTGSVTVVK